MICKFCNAEVSEEHKFCPNCGKGLTEETQIVDQEVQASEGKPKKKKWPLVLAIVGGVVALGILAVALLVALGVDFKWLLPRENDIHYKEAYTVSDENALKQGDTVIATINGRELTNTQLQIFYRMQVMDFLNYYGEYASYVGMDYTKPLSEQTCYYDETMTWEQYFLDISIDTWQNYQILALLAEEAGHVMSEQWQESLDGLAEELQQQAELGEFESVEAMLQKLIGPGCSQEDYEKYVHLIYLSNDYYASEYERLTPSDEDVQAYFTEHEETFSQQGITKESGLISSVRHILISPEGGTTDEETGETTYTDEEWAACLTKAQQLLDSWKAGEATEESFAKLASIHSSDVGSVYAGGLYKNITKGYMVEEFDAWIYDEGRKVGDTAIIKTSYGWHIMYYSGEGLEAWQAAVFETLQDEEYDADIATIQAMYEPVYDQSVIDLFPGIM